MTRSEIRWGDTRQFDSGPVRMIIVRARAGPLVSHDNHTRLIDGPVPLLLLLFRAAWREE